MPQQWLTDDELRQNARFRQMRNIQAHWNREHQLDLSLVPKVNLYWYLSTLGCFANRVAADSLPLKEVSSRFSAHFPAALVESVEALPAPVHYRLAMMEYLLRLAAGQPVVIMGPQMFTTLSRLLLTSRQSKGFGLHILNDEASLAARIQLDARARQFRKPLIVQVLQAYRTLPDVAEVAHLSRVKGRMEAQLLEAACPDVLRRLPGFQQAISTYAVPAEERFIR
jgi:hypothetical protein